MESPDRLNERFVDISPCLLYVYDLKDNRGTYCNDKVQETLGYTLDEIQDLGEEFLPVVFHPEDWGAYQDKIVPWYAKAQDGEFIRYQYRMKHREGRWVWLESTEQVHSRTPDGGPWQIIGAAVDVTGHRMSEEALTQSHTLYRTLVENLNTAILLTDMDGLFLHANQKFLDLSGYSSEEVSSLRPGVLFADPRVKETLLEVLGRSGSVADFQFQALRKGRGPVWVSMNASLVRDAEDRPQGLLATVLDIDQRRATELALVESERRYRMVFDHSGTANSIYDSRGRLVLQNNLAREYLGDPDDLAQGKTPREIFGPDLGATMEIRLNRVLATGVPESFDSEYDGAQGSKWFHTIFQPLRGRENEVTGIQVISQDITEKMALLDMNQRNQKLESLAFLAGGIAHDFNNLLGGIYASVEVARKVTDPQVRDRSLGRALGTLERARALTNQLLTFAKGGNPVLKAEALDQFLKDTVAFALSGTPVAGEVRLAPDLKSALCDIHQLGQVIDNLVINAAQAMESGGIVAVEASNESVDFDPQLPPGDYLRITVRDHGPGIPPEVVPRIFDPFFTTKAKGHGLGLATCYSIVKKHRGSIEVSSTPGVGTVFTLRIPSADPSPPMDPREMVSPRSLGGRVLILDDEVSISQPIKELLEDAGYGCEVAVDGRDAVCLFIEAQDRGQPFDWAILDLTIPGGMGGLEAGRDLRLLSPTVRLIVSSGYSEDDAVAHPEAYGFQGRLRKPFTLDEVLEVLDRR